MKHLVTIVIIGIFTFSISTSISAQTPERKIPYSVTWTPDAACKTEDLDEATAKQLQPSCDSFVMEGSKVRVIQTSRVTVGVVVAFYEGYLVADVYVVNKTKERMLLDPNLAIIWMYKNAGKSEGKMVNSIPPNQIAKKIQNRVAWANALSSFGAALQTKTITADSQTSGSVSMNDTRGNGANGTFNSTTTTTATVPDVSAQQQSQRQNQQRISTQGARAAAIEDAGLLANTLFENGSANGLIYFKNQKFDIGIFVLVLDGAEFHFALTNR